MGRLIQGSLIVLFIVVVGALVAFIKDGAINTVSGFGCETQGQNATECAGIDESDNFLDTVRDANPAELGEGAPDIVNALWVMVFVFLLGVAIALIALAFIPLTAE